MDANDATATAELADRMAYLVALDTIRGIMTHGGARIAFRGSTRDRRGFATIGGECGLLSV